MSIRIVSCKIKMFCDLCNSRRPSEMVKAEFSGANEGDCEKQARAAGWTIKISGRYRWGDPGLIVACPKCNGIEAANVQSIHTGELGGKDGPPVRLEIDDRP
jgi:hypothetical protein